MNNLCKCVWRHDWKMRFTESPSTWAALALQLLSLLISLQTTSALQRSDCKWNIELFVKSVRLWHFMFQLVYALCLLRIVENNPRCPYEIYILRYIYIYMLRPLREAMCTWVLNVDRVASPLRKPRKTLVKKKVVSWSRKHRASQLANEFDISVRPLHGRWVIHQDG